MLFRSSFVVSTSSKDIPKSENVHETTRRKCKPKELSLGTIRNATNSSEKPDYTTSSPLSSSSTTKKSSTHTRNGKSANDSKPAAGKPSEGKPKRTRPKKKNPHNWPPLTKPIRTRKKTTRQPDPKSRHTPRSPYRPYPGASGAALLPVIPLENLHPDSIDPPSIATEENKSDRWRVNLIPSFSLSISMSRNWKSPFSPTIPHNITSHFLVSSVFC